MQSLYFAHSRDVLFRIVFTVLFVVFQHWIEELAKEAQLWADQCRPQKTPEEHDTCRDLCKSYHRRQTIKLWLDLVRYA